LQIFPQKNAKKMMQACLRSFSLLLRHPNLECSDQFGHELHEEQRKEKIFSQKNMKKKPRFGIFNSKIH